MKLKQISVPIENSHDRLYEITKALADRGIRPRAFTLVDKGNFGELRLLVSDLTAARQILMQREIPGRIDEVVALEIRNQPGHLSHIIQALMDAEINIKYSYAYAGNHLGKTIMIFCFSDNDRALQVLSEKRIHALDYLTFDMLEAAA
ncbi:MAG: amino acid-binding protein [Desulfobacterales bacterium]